MRLAVREGLGGGFRESAGSFPDQEEKHRLQSGALAVLKLELAAEGLIKCGLWDPTP